MARAWKGTPEEREVIREISKHPVGTSAMDIFSGFDSQTWQVLKSANRIDGTTKEWSVYRTLCRMLQDPKIQDRAEEFRKQVEVKSDSTTKKNGLDQIIEETISRFNDEVQKAITQISQKALQRLKNQIDDYNLNN